MSARSQGFACFPRSPSPRGSVLIIVLDWKFSSADIRERGFWGEYMHAFEEAIRATAAHHAPWFVVPADNKWFTRLVVAATIVEAVEKLELSYPKIDAAKKKELVTARAALAREKYRDRSLALLQSAGVWQIERPPLLQAKQSVDDWPRLRAQTRSGPLAGRWG
jgi:Polyphosphate kinase 2 (PPK2)